MVTSATIITLAPVDGERAFMEKAALNVLADYVNAADGYLSRMDVLAMTRDLVAVTAKGYRIARNKGEVYR